MSWNVLNIKCSGCSNLERFPEITGKMEILKELHLDETTIKELPSSIGHLTVVEVLNLACCKSLSLEGFPGSISKLQHLKSLCHTHCWNLGRFPEITGKMEILKKLYLDKTTIEELHASIDIWKDSDFGCHGTLGIKCRSKRKPLFFKNTTSNLGWFV